MNDTQLNLIDPGEFVIGCNYWASHAGTAMWSDWQPEVVDADLKLLAQADLALDTANPSMDLMNANVMLADAVPDLRIIMDHLPSFDPTPDNQAAYEAVIKEMAARPNIFVKLTEVYHPKPGDNGIVVKNYEFLRARLNDAGGLELFPNQSSGVLTSAVWADALVDLPPGQVVRRGDSVRLLLLSSLIGA